MRVLIACEFSGIVREAFAARGHDTWSCDIIPTEQKGNHLLADVMDIINDGWDMMIAHPPCTYLAVSGARWLYNIDKTPKEIRWTLMKEACEFFNLLLSAPIERICIENPVMHSYARLHIRSYSQLINPGSFGHNEQKRTCLWLKNLPYLKPTQFVSYRTTRVHHEVPSPDRWKNRSRSFPGIASAMAEQWG